MKKLSKYQKFSRVKERAEGILGRTLTDEEKLLFFKKSGAFTRKSNEDLEAQEAKRQFNAMMASVKSEDGIRRFMRTIDKEMVDILTEEDPSKLDSVIEAQRPSIEKMQKNVEKASSIAFMIRNQMRMDLEQLRKVD